MRTAKVLSVSIVLGGLAVCAPGAAQPAAPPAKPVAQAMTEKARELFAEGVKAYKQSRWADAHASFLAAWALSKHYSIAGNLADCELKLGLYRDAAEHFARYVREMGKDTTSTPQERQDGEARYAQARARVGQVDVQVSVPGAEVYIDGKLIGAAPLEDPVFIDPGSHVVEARSEGYPAARVPIEAKAGIAQPVTLTLVKAQDAVAAPPPPTGSVTPLKSKGSDQVPPPRHRSVVPGAVLGSVAGAALATGVGLVVAGAKKHATNTSLANAITQAHHSCVTGAANFDPQCSTLETSSSAADALGRAGLGVLIGAGALAVGSVVYFVWPEPKPHAPASGGVRVVPVASTSSGGVFVSGTF